MGEAFPPVAPGAVVAEISMSLDGYVTGPDEAAAALVPPGEPVWARVAPGNVASVRAFLAAGYRPVGAEVLLS